MTRPVHRLFTAVPGSASSATATRLNGSVGPHSTFTTACFDKLRDKFFGKPIPFPALDRPELTQPRVGSYNINSIVKHPRGQGSSGPHNYRYRLRPAGYGATDDVWYRAHEIPQCQEMVAAYRAANGLHETTCPSLKSKSNSNSKSAPKSKSNKK